MELMKWANIIFFGDSKQRMKVVDACLKAILIFQKGEPSKAGKEAHALLTSNKVDLIGFVPYVNYIRAKSKCEDDMDVLWTHPFSVPTMLFRVKGTPFLLLANPNVEYNESKLLENEENRHLAELNRLLGIIG